MSDVIVDAISDLHGHLPDPGEFEGCDLVAIPGDVCPDGRPAETHARLRDVFGPWLDALPAPAVGVAGNHDFIFERTEDPHVPYLPWTYLQDSGVELAGLTVWGCPWVTDIVGWAFCAPKSDPEGFMAERCALIPDGVDLLITHAPPHGKLDTAWGDGRFGSRALMATVREKRPRLHVFGHIHEARGASGVGSFDAWTMLANCSYVNWTMRPIYAQAPYRFGIPRDRAAHAWRR